MLTEAALREFVEDGLRRLHPSITSAARARIIARHAATEHRVMLDSEHRDGLIRSLFEADSKRNPDDYRRVPSPAELLEGETARLVGLGVPPDAEAKLTIFRTFERMDEDEKLAAADALNLKPAGDAPAPTRVKDAAPTNTPKRVIDMSEAEVEALIVSKFGPAPPSGRLASEFRKYRDALIEAERSAHTERAAREVEAAKLLEEARGLSAEERIRAYRAAQ